jgi:hypothetical protein
MAGVEPVTEKRCTGCSAWLPLEEFPAQLPDASRPLVPLSGMPSCGDEGLARSEPGTRECRTSSRLSRAAPACRARLRRVRAFAGRPDALVCSRMCRRERQRPSYCFPDGLVVVLNERAPEAERQEDNPDHLEDVGHPGRPPCRPPNSALSPLSRRNLMREPSGPALVAW